MIDYEDSVAAIAAQRGDAVAVTTMTQSGHWNSISDRPELDVGIANGMGKASSLGLGIALGAPESKR